MNRSRLAAGAFGVVAALWLGCTWVPLTAGGEQVLFANQKAVDGCRQVARTDAHTSAKVWIFARSESTIREELRSLARNDAATQDDRRTVVGVEIAWNIEGRGCRIAIDVDGCASENLAVLMRVNIVADEEFH